MKCVGEKKAVLAGSVSISGKGGNMVSEDIRSRRRWIERPRNGGGLQAPVS